MSFQDLAPLAPEPMLSLIDRFASDRRPGKIDLGVGVYQDPRGETPVFEAVKRAEAQLLLRQRSKAYLGGDGDREFLARLGAEAFGGAWRLGALQTVGGTGALRLAAELLARAMPRRRIWLGTPTWSNHVPLLRAAGLEVAACDLADPASGRVRPEALLDALRDAHAGDAVLVQACCHNPTGLDPQPPFWDALAREVEVRRLVPLVDTAYQGLGAGWSADGAGLRLLLERAPQLLIAYSCDKNFGLYRERVGALYHRGRDAAETRRMHDHLVAIARVNYSMPSDHGAATVRTILEDARLRSLWSRELSDAARRVASVRAALAAHGRIGAVDLAAIAAGRGLFARLELTPPAIERLQRDHAIYVAPSGRVNLAGLGERNLDRFVAALDAAQRLSAA